MSFIGKSLFSLSWLGQLFNDSVWPRTRQENPPYLKSDYHQDSTAETTAKTFKTIQEGWKRRSEPFTLEDNQLELGEDLALNEQQVSNDFIEDYQDFLESKQPLSFWQRRRQRDDAAQHDSYSSESSLSSSVFSDFAQSKSGGFSEQSSFDESFERSSTPGSDTKQCQYGNQLIVMSGDDFGWSLSDVADDPRRTGLANFRHNILIRPVPAPCVETVASSRLQGPSFVHYSPHHNKRRQPSHHCRSTVELRSDYDTGRGSGSSSFNEEDGCQPARVVHHGQQREPRLRHFSSDTDEAGKPYRRMKTVSQCSDSCLGSDFPSLTSTGSSESEMMAVIDKSSTKCTGPANSHFYTGAYTKPARQQQSKLIGETSETNQQRTIGTLSNTSSQTSIGSSDCWHGSIQHALTVMEHRGQEMDSLFDQLHEIGDDLALMDDQVGQVTSTLQQCSSKRRQVAPEQRRPFAPSHSVGSYRSLPSNKPERRGSVGSVSGAVHRRHVGSCLDLRSLTEDEMAVIVHRLLTRVCEHTLARQEGRLEVPLIV